jgi:hypothetical protein
MTVLLTHKEQAEHNEKVAISLSETEFFDWAITCAFYSALHYVEAKFASIPEVEHSEVLYQKSRIKMDAEDVKMSVHTFREILIGKYFKSIRSQYSQLRTSSEMVRYLETTHDKPAFKFINKETAKRLIQGLISIKKALSSSPG